MKNFIVKGENGDKFIVLSIDNEGEFLLAHMETKEFWWFENTEELKFVGFLPDKEELYDQKNGK